MFIWTIHDLIAGVVVGVAIIILIIGKVINLWGKRND